MLSTSGEVAQEWIDENIHVNMVHYTEIIDNLINQLESRINGEYLINQKISTKLVVRRLFVHHRKELLLGDMWKAKLSLVRLSLPRATFSIDISATNFLAAKAQAEIVFSSIPRLSHVEPWKYLELFFVSWELSGLRDYFHDDHE